jgi:hypothetical protein
MAKDWLAENSSWFDSRQEQEICLFFSSVQAGSGAELASYTTGTGASFLREKWPRREADHSLPSSVEIKNGGAICPLPPYVLKTQYLIN